MVFRSHDESQTYLSILFIIITYYNSFHIPLKSDQTQTIVPTLSPINPVTLLKPVSNCIHTITGAHLVLDLDLSAADLAHISI